MPSFVEGDIVKSKDTTGWSNGLIGRVRKLYHGDYLVEFNEVEAKGHGHSGWWGDTCRSRWWLPPSLLELVSNQAQETQVVAQKEIDKIKAAKIDWFALNKDFA